MSRKTIKDIAKEAGVSTTTVFKALNGKSKISEEMRKRIIDIADKSGYTRNRNAQALARKKIRIGVIVCDYPSEFQQYIIKGCQDSFNYYKDFKIEPELDIYSQFKSWQKIREYLNSYINSGVNGIVIEPGYEIEKYIDLLETAIEKGIAVVTLTTDLPNIKRIGSVTVNTRVVGRMAAQILKMNIRESNSVVILTGTEELDIHKSYISSFQEMCGKLSLNLINVYETFEKYDIAYSITEKIIKDKVPVGGIYVSSYNSVGVCDCIKKHCLSGEIKVIGQDLYRGIVDCLNDGSLCATIYQNPYQQAKSAIDMLVSYLSTGVLKAENERIIPQLVMTSNLECFLDKF